MPNESEQRALSKIKAYLDDGRSLDEIRRAGWGSWVDHLQAEGYDLRTGQLATSLPAVETTPPQRLDIEEVAEVGETGPGTYSQAGKRVTEVFWQVTQTLLSSLWAALVWWWNFARTRETGWGRLLAVAAPVLGVIILIAIVSSPGGGGGESSDAESPSTAAQGQQEQSRQEPPPRDTGRYSDSDVEYQLAVVDKGGFVATDDSSIDLYDRALDRAERKCTDNRRRIGDYAVKDQQLLEERGIRASILELINAIDQSIPAEIAPTSCADIAALLVTLMVGG